MTTNSANDIGSTTQTTLGTVTTGTWNGTTVAVANGGTGVTTSTGSTNVVLSNSPTLVTPILGAASATSINLGGTALANYLEGTWVPVFTSSGGGSATYATQVGSYTRIGNRVLINLGITLSGLPSAGNVTIAGLPVASAATYFSSLAVYCNALNAAVTSPLLAQIGPSSSVISLWTFAAGNVTQLTVANSSSTTTLIIAGEYKV